MAVNVSQIADIVNKLWSRTQSGSISWEQFGNYKSFQARLGDFVVSISKPYSGRPGSLALGIASDPDVDLLVKRLDGKTVYTTQPSQNALGGLLGSLSTVTSLPSDTRNTLKLLFDYVSNRDTDLDELLKIL